jgi:thymidylate synthase
MIDIEYIKNLKEIDNNGIWQNDRTSVGRSKQLFGVVTRFNTKGEFAPFIQCRTFSPRISFEEWKWMMSGSTDANILQQKNIHIWDGNTTREFLDARGLFDVPVNHIGKAYGYQYRSFGGVSDQVKSVFKSLRDNPNSRRHVISIWNPNELSEMALEPCFHLYEFMYVNGVLNLYVHGRSSDYTFGMPYNLSFSYFWLASFSKALGYKMGEIMITTTNTHYYENQVELVEALISEDATEMINELSIPICSIKKEIKSLEDILSLEWHDIEISNWVKGPTLTDKKIEMAV